MIMLFDTWASGLSGQDYEDLVLPSLAWLRRSVQKLEVPVIYFPGIGLKNMGEAATYIPPRGGGDELIV